MGLIREGDEGVYRVSLSAGSVAHLVHGPIVVKKDNKHNTGDDSE